MSVIKFILGFIAGAIGLFGGGAILFWAVFAPIVRMSGIDVYYEDFWIPAGLSAGLAVYIGSGFAPPVWNWGLRLGAIVPILLLVPSTLETFLR